MVQHNHAFTLLQNLLPYQMGNNQVGTYKAKKNTLVSGNADVKKNLQPGDRKLIFLIILIEFLK